MADTNEEQLLSDLLDGIAREDAALDAPHLEARVMAALDVSHAVRTPATAYVKYLAAAAAAAVVVVSAWITRQVEPVERAVARSPRVVAESSVPVDSAISTTVTVLTGPTPPTAPTRATTPTRPNLADPQEFLPLMPMTDRELSGPFQLVRVQMPRASLGGLRSPLDHPNEIVEADVLLGEDGMARAISVSTGGAVQPWRSR